MCFTLCCSSIVPKGLPSLDRHGSKYTSGGRYLVRARCSNECTGSHGKRQKMHTDGGRGEQLRAAARFTSERFPLMFSHADLWKAAQAHTCIRGGFYLVQTCFNFHKEYRLCGILLSAGTPLLEILQLSSSHYWSTNMTQIFMYMWHQAFHWKKSTNDFYRAKVPVAFILHGDQSDAWWPIKVGLLEVFAHSIWIWTVFCSLLLLWCRKVKTNVFFFVFFCLWEINRWPTYGAKINNVL